MAETMSARFPVTDEQPVTLTVDVGNGQFASSLVTIAGRQPIRRRDSFELSLGLGRNLEGKTVRCTTIVTDVRPETNRTNLRVRVRDGVSSVDESRSAEAEESGIVAYVTQIRFR